ncbi:hypothetical protein FACS1894208_12700 [Clostridia bacterium]|nr:hypothetical protein FACS1894208_12700 [Clostridia bacterium]
MTDIISKIIGVLLAFALLVITPLVIVRMADDMAEKRLILNEVSNFIDRVTDKANVTADDIDDLYLAINSHGGAFDVEVVRYERTAIPDGAGRAKSVYIATDDVFGTNTVNLKGGDAVQVRVFAISKTTAQTLLFRLLRVNEPDFKFTLAGTVRQ